MLTNYSFRNQELNLDTELRSSLMQIWGVGWLRACQVSAKMGVAYPQSAYKVNSYIFAGINFLLNNMLTSKVTAQRSIIMNIRRLGDINSYHGLRHKLYLPVRGQRSRTNGRTNKRLKFKR